MTVRVVCDTNIWISRLISHVTTKWDHLIFTDELRLLYGDRLIARFAGIGDKDMFG